MVGWRNKWIWKKMQREGSKEIMFERVKGMEKQSERELI
jgi:hypothetical protein